MIEALAAIAGAPASPSVASSTQASAGADSVFSQLMERTIASADQNMVNAETALQQLASGQPVEIHDVMIALETARISVQTLVQVRNRMVEAYQELMRMQI